MRSVPFSPSHLVWTGAEGEISCLCRESIGGCWRATRQTLIPRQRLIDCAVRRWIHDSRTTYIPASERPWYLSGWRRWGLAAHWVEALAQAVHAGDWPKAHSISGCLGTELTVAT